MVAVMNYCYVLSAMLASSTVKVASFSVSTPTSNHARLSSSSASSLTLQMSTDFFDYPGEDQPDDENSFSPSFNSNRRTRREARELQALQTTFVVGDDLYDLRREVLGLRSELEIARAAGPGGAGRVKELERAILAAQSVDAEFIYQVSTERAQAAERAGLSGTADRYREQALVARNALPQFQLEGLWVGKYGDEGFEMINVTYSGDTLTARKVTESANSDVPEGEVSFTVDLSAGAAARRPDLEPIELGEEASRHWGFKFLQRFGGMGQIAADDNGQAQFVEGQLLLVKNFFSFAFLPNRHQVFFGRPSAELTLQLLREANSKKFADNAFRDHLSRCMLETELLDDEMEVDDGSLFRSHNQDDLYNQDGCFE